MVDPRIYDNPYRRPNAGTIARDVDRQNMRDAALIPKGAIAEPMPSDGRIVKLVACLRCKHKAVPYVFAPRNRVYTSTCRDCGQPHVFHPKDFDMSIVQREGAKQAVGPERTYRGQKYVDASKTFEDLKRKRELGPAYWRNPK